MGSGCNPTGASGVFKPIPDTSVIYTGAPLTALGICTGDTLSEVESVILAQIINFTKGRNITLSEIDLTQCACFEAKVGCCGPEACQSLSCILQAYLDCLCEIYGDVQQLKTEVAEMYDGPYTTGCLTGVTSASKLPDIIKAMITQICTLVTTVADLQDQIDTINTGLDAHIGDFLNTHLTSCQTGGLIKTGTGASFTADFKGFNPIGAIIMYGGSLAGKFDSTGLGINPGSMCGWALCNGLNGTIDMRGYFPTGVNDGTMGSGSQNAEVDNAANPGQAYALNDHGGEVKHLLNSAECASPPHTHTVTDGGHQHVMKAKLRTGHMGDGNEAYVDWTNNPDAPDSTGIAAEGIAPNNASISSGYTIRAEVLSHTSNITINPSSAVSASASHENRPPYRALYFIQRIY